MHLVWQTPPTQDSEQQSVALVQASFAGLHLPTGEAQTPLAQFALQHSPEFEHAVPVCVQAAPSPVGPSGTVPSAPPSVVPPLSLPQPAAQRTEHASTATGTKIQMRFVMTASSPAPKATGSGPDLP
jgi:hypothetical protein